MITLYHNLPRIASHFLKKKCKVELGNIFGLTLVGIRFFPDKSKPFGIRVEGTFKVKVKFTCKKRECEEECTQTTSVITIKNLVVELEFWDPTLYDDCQKVVWDKCQHLLGRNRESEWLACIRAGATNCPGLEAHHFVDLNSARINLQDKVHSDKVKDLIAEKHCTCPSVYPPPEIVEQPGSNFLIEQAIQDELNMSMDTGSGSPSREAILCGIDPDTSSLVWGKPEVVNYWSRDQGGCNICDEMGDGWGVPRVTIKWEFTFRCGDPAVSGCPSGYVCPTDFERTIEGEMGSRIGVHLAELLNQEDIRFLEYRCPAAGKRLRHYYEHMYVDDISICDCIHLGELQEELAACGMTLKDIINMDNVNEFFLGATGFNEIGRAGMFYCKCLKLIEDPPPKY